MKKKGRKGKKAVKVQGILDQDNDKEIGFPFDDTLDNEPISFDHHRPSTPKLESPKTPGEFDG